MRELTFSRFSSAKGVLRANPISRNWSHWVRTLTTLKPTPNKDTTNFVFGHISKGETRSDKHVQWLDAMALDIDGVSDETVEQIFEKLSQFEFVLYTSFNHKNEKLDPTENNKLRILLPLADRIPPNKYKGIQSQFDSLIGGNNDKGVRKISQPYYVYSIHPDRKDVAFFIHNTGRWVELKDLPQVSQYESAAAEEFAASMEISKGDLLEESQRLSRSKSSHKKKLGVYFSRVSKGEAFVTDNTRDNAMFLMACHVADIWPHVDPLQAAELFRESLEALYTVRQFEIGVDAAVLEMRNKIRRKQEKISTERSEKAHEQRSHKERVNSRIRSDGAPHDYTDAEIATMAEMHGVTTSEILRMAIVYCGSANFFLTPAFAICFKAI